RGQPTEAAAGRLGLGADGLRRPLHRRRPRRPARPRQPPAAPRRDPRAVPLLRLGPALLLHPRDPRDGPRRPHPAEPRALGALGARAQWKNAKRVISAAKPANIIVPSEMNPMTIACCRPSTRPSSRSTAR